MTPCDLGPCKISGIGFPGGFFQQGTVREPVLGVKSVLDEVTKGGTVVADSTVLLPPSERA
jgi:hypothetical protein